MILFPPGNDSLNHKNGRIGAPEFAAAYAATGVCLLELHWMKRFDTVKKK